MIFSNYQVSKKIKKCLTETTTAEVSSGENRSKETGNAPNAE